MTVEQLQGTQISQDPHILGVDYLHWDEATSSASERGEGLSIASLLAKSSAPIDAVLAADVLYDPVQISNASMAQRNICVFDGAYLQTNTADVNIVLLSHCRKLFRL